MDNAKMINSQASGRAGGSTSITRLSSTASQAIRDNIHRNLPRSPFRFINRSTDDERLAMSERFRAEGLDARKLSDAQRLPYVWRWLVDADINCLSLRHQIDKMKRQHEEDLQQVEDYIEQIWKLSTQRLLVLEDENRVLKQKLQNPQTSKLRSKLPTEVSSSQHSTEGKTIAFDQNKNLIRETQQQSISFATEDEDDGNEDDSDEEFRKCLDNVDLLRGLRPKKNINSLGISSAGSRLVNSISSYTLSSSDNSTLYDSPFACDSNAIRSKLPRSASTNNFASNSVNIASSSTNNKSNIKMGYNNRKVRDSLCEQCEKLSKELLDLNEAYEKALTELNDANEKNFVLEKLNRCIEIENENFAFKLAESEGQNEQLERQINKLEQKQRQMKNNNINGNNNNMIMVERRLIDELNAKVKNLEEKLDQSLQSYEELENKYCNRKEKHKETIDKLRRYMADTKPTNVSENKIFQLRRQSDSNLLGSIIKLS